MTLSDLFASVPFRAFFEFEFGEAAYRQYRALDVVLLANPEITITGQHESTYRGRFICQTEVLAEEHGTASGTIWLDLSEASKSEDPHAVLDRATLSVVIETAPFGRSRVCCLS